MRKRVQNVTKTNVYRTMTTVFDWLIHMMAYTIILMILSMIFVHTIEIDNSYFGLWPFLACVIIYVLNKTIKPFIVWLTIPITAMTMGIFYPVINVVIIKLVDFMLGSHFTIHGLWMSFMIAILISLLNMLVDKLIINPILRKEH